MRIEDVAKFPLWADDCFIRDADQQSVACILHDDDVVADFVNRINVHGDLVEALKAANVLLRQYIKHQIEANEAAIAAATGGGKAMSGHTPGPWDYSPSHNLEGSFCITGSNKHGASVLPILAMTFNWPRHAEANARLIAAAPQLLEALREIAAGCINRQPGHLDYQDNRTKEEIRQIALVAIAAATPQTGREEG